MNISVMIQDFSTENYNTSIQKTTESISVTDKEVEEYKNENKEKLIKLKEFLLDTNKKLDAESIQNHLFPIIEYDIFLSHAHGDEDDVIKLAIILRKKGLRVFIDSCVWGNAYKLLKAIDKEYCRNEGETTYNYEQRNFSTANVYMILNTALHKVIHNSEILIFLGTRKSTTELTVNDAIKEKKGLSSPWIYSELTFAQQVERIDRRDHLKEYRYYKKLAEDHQPAIESASFKMHYPIPKTDYILDNNHFTNWLKQKDLPLNLFTYMLAYQKNEQQLEFLYRTIYSKGVDFQKYI